MVSGISLVFRSKLGLLGVSCFVGNTLCKRGICSGKSCDCATFFGDGDHDKADIDEEALVGLFLLLDVDRVDVNVGSSSVLM